MRSSISRGELRSATPLAKRGSAESFPTNLLGSKVEPGAGSRDDIRYRVPRVKQTGGGTKHEDETMSWDGRAGSQIYSNRNCSLQKSEAGTFFRGDGGNKAEFCRPVGMSGEQSHATTARGRGPRT